MPPDYMDDMATSPIAAQVPLLEMASAELETLRGEATDAHYHAFPPACLSLLKSYTGNEKCIDCGALDPQWATVKYGALLCLQCSGQHRGLGVQVSSVRSIAMDEWSHSEVLSMLEGGNSQLLDFFHRHRLCIEHHANNEGKFITKDNVTLMRYKTKAALFYRQQMELHVDKVVKSGEYKGREASRRLRHRKFDQRNSFMM